MMNLKRPVFDARLIDRYGGEGPRYTSYPTALQFSDRFGSVQWLRALAESNRFPIPADLSIYVHVPFCSSPCFYCGCNRVITRSKLAGEEYLAYLEREIQQISKHIDPDRLVRQVHLGGGTPTFLDPSQLDRVLDLLHRSFNFVADPEMGLEVDPRTVMPEGIHRLAGSGFNRISVGIQDLNPDVQRAVNRIHGETEVAAVIDAARAAGFGSISVDLIYGLPLQTTVAFAHTIERVIAMKPDRISLFNYAHMPNKFVAQKQIRSEDLPSSSIKLAIFRNTLNRLLDSGYEWIGMDHFALPGDALAQARKDGSLVRNFQGYSTNRGLDLLGFGPSAISQVAGSFVQNHRTLQSWQRSLEAGQLPLARGLEQSPEDELRARVISHILCRGSLCWREFESEYGIVFSRYFEAEITKLRVLAEDGLIDWVDGGFQATAAGLLFVRAVAMVFDQYLGGKSNHAASLPGHYSRII